MHVLPFSFYLMSNHFISIQCALCHKKKAALQLCWEWCRLMSMLGIRLGLSLICWRCNLFSYLSHNIYIRDSDFISFLPSLLAFIVRNLASMNEPLALIQIAKNHFNGKRFDFSSIPFHRRFSGTLSRISCYRFIFQLIFFCVVEQILIYWEWQVNRRRDGSLDRS